MSFYTVVDSWALQVIEPKPRYLYHITLEVIDRTLWRAIESFLERQQADLLSIENQHLNDLHTQSTLSSTRSTPVLHSVLHFPYAVQHFHVQSAIEVPTSTSCFTSKEDRKIGKHANPQPTNVLVRHRQTQQLPCTSPSNIAARIYSGSFRVFVDLVLKLWKYETYDIPCVRHTCHSGTYVLPSYICFLSIFHIRFAHIFKLIFKPVSSAFRLTTYKVQTLHFLY